MKENEQHDGFYICLTDKIASILENDSRLEETLSTFYLDGFSSDSQNESLFHDERQQVLESGFSAYFEDTENLKKY